MAAQPKPTRFFSFRCRCGVQTNSHISPAGRPAAPVADPCLFRVPIRVADAAIHNFRRKPQLALGASSSSSAGGRGLQGVRRLDMARVLISSAMRMKRAIGGGAQSIRGLSSAAKVGAMVEEVKQTGVCSVGKETLRNTVLSIKLDRENKMLQKAKWTWLMAGLVLVGSTFASTLVAEAHVSGVETVKEK
ncbi:unnamed protein product [Urochloa humidicola]